MSKKILSLEAFVSDSLTQIIEGIHGAQQNAETKDAIINPNRLIASAESSKDASFVQFTTGNRNGHEFASIIDFDIAVTVADSKSISGGAKGKAKGFIGVIAGSLEVGGKGESRASTSSVSRIKFRLPVRFPPHEE